MVELVLAAKPAVLLLLVIIICCGPPQFDSIDVKPNSVLFLDSL